MGLETEVYRTNTFDVPKQLKDAGCFSGRAYVRVIRETLPGDNSPIYTVNAHLEPEFVKTRDGKVILGNPGLSDRLDVDYSNVVSDDLDFMPTAVFQETETEAIDHANFLIENLAKWQENI